MMREYGIEESEPAEGETVENEEEPVENAQVDKISML